MLHRSVRTVGTGRAAGRDTQAPPPSSDAATRPTGVHRARGSAGQRTIDEMAFAWIGWHDLTAEEYEAEVASREEARQRTDEN